MTTTFRTMFKPGLLALSVFLLISCGGGGGGGAAAPVGPDTTLSGTAAAGAPISGTVTLKDSTTPTAIQRTVAIEVDGSYSIDTTGMTAPFVLRAEGSVGGRDYVIHSAATAADIGGTINITPLTDLIIANIAADVAANYFDAGAFAGVTASNLDAQEAALQARLAAVLTALGVNAAVDLLRSSFNADHTGLDAALDILTVTVDPATDLATITNVINNQQIIDDLASQVDVAVLSATDTGASTASNYQMIVENLAAFSQQFATSLPASNSAALLALFDAGTFKYDGANLTQFLAEITSAPTLIGNLNFYDITVLAMTPVDNPTAATVSARCDGCREVLNFNFIKEGLVWKSTGNQRIASADASTFARQDNMNGGVIDTGLLFEIKDEWAVGIDYAVARGAGLPPEGALYVNRMDGNSFGVAVAPYAGTSTPAMFSWGHNQYPLADAVISTLTDTESYTIELWEDNGTTGDAADDTMRAEYSSVLSKRPYLLTELNAGAFATITTLSADIGAFAVNGGSLTVNWILPVGKSASELHFFRSDSSFVQDSVSVDLVAASTSATLTIGAPAFTVQGCGINLYTTDVFGRELSTQLNGQCQ